MRAGDVHVAHGIFVVELGALNALSAATLRLIFGERGTLNNAVGRDRYDHRLFRNEIFVVDIDNLFLTDRGAARVGVLRFDVEQVLTDDRENIAFVRKNAAVFRNVGKERVVLVGELLLLQVDQLAERHL